MPRPGPVATARRPSRPSPKACTAFAIDEWVSGRGVDPTGGRAAQAALARFRQPHLAGRGQRVEGGNGGRVVDGSREGGRQPHEAAQPVQGHLLQLGGRRGGPPHHRVDVERRREELPEDAGPGSGNGEVGEEARVVPVRDPRHHHRLEVLEERLHGLPRVRHLGRESATHLPRLHGGQDRMALHLLQVVGHPVHEPAPPFAELPGRHAARRRRRHSVRIRAACRRIDLCSRCSASIWSTTSSSSLGPSGAGPPEPCRRLKKSASV